MSSFIARHKEEKDLICEVLQSHVMPYKFKDKEGKVHQGYSSLCNVVWFRETDTGLIPLDGEESPECPALESAKLLEFEALDWEDYHDDDDDDDDDVIEPEVVNPDGSVSADGPVSDAEKEA